MAGITEPGARMEAAKHQLDEFGWTVVDSVVPVDSCDQYVDQINTWLKPFQPGFPNNIHSIIHQYNISHIAPAWSARLKAKPVFASIWGTEKLHTSLDGIAVGRPPELGETRFVEDQVAGANQLHLDQGALKKGLHAFQGAVYLEEATEEDWTFMVIEKSHNFHKKFFECFPSRGKSEFRPLSEGEVSWYEQQGCTVKRLAIPKGGMVLWDSRTVHAGAPAVRGRQHSNRWRYIVFVSMTPAIWSRPEDVRQKQECYRSMRISRHWSSQGFSMFPHKRQHRCNITEMPDVAMTDEARLLAGDLEYDFGDGRSNGPSWKPVINK